MQVYKLYGLTSYMEYCVMQSVSVKHIIQRKLFFKISKFMFKTNVTVRKSKIVI